MELYVIIIDTNTGWVASEKVFKTREEAELFANEYNRSETLSNSEDPYYEISVALVKVVEI